MNKYLATLFLLALLLSVQSVYAQHAKFGIGGMINGPTGFSAKAWFNENFAIDAAFSFGIASNSSVFYLHGNALKHHEMEPEGLSGYYGMGLRFLWADSSNNYFTGLRWPVGLNYLFEDERLEGFFELAPTLDFATYFRFTISGAAGMRIYLN